MWSKKELKRPRVITTPSQGLYSFGTNAQAQSFFGDSGNSVFFPALKKKQSFFGDSGDSVFLPALKKNRVFLGTQKTCDFEGGSS